MTLLLRTIRAPVGTCDIQVVCFEGSECFAAASGCIVRIYAADGTEVASLLLPAAASAILAHGKQFSVFGDGCVYTYTDRELVGTTVYPRTLFAVRRVAEAGGRFVVLHAHGYAVGTIARGRPVLGRALTDGSFYCAIGAAAAGGGIAILAKTLRTTNIIRHGQEAGAPVHTPLPAGNFLFAHRGRLFVVDRRGLWECTDRLVFVRELGNTVVTAACSAGSLILLFCLNGEVFELADDAFSVRAVLVLQTAVTSAAQAGGSFLCGSSECLYFVSSSYKITWTVCSPGLVRSSTTLGGEVRFLTAKASVAVESKIWTHLLHQDNSIGGSEGKTTANDRAGRHKIENYKIYGNRVFGYNKTVSFRLDSIFKTQKLNILTYNYFSVLNNQIVQRIHSCYEIDGTSAFTTELSMVILEDTCTILPLQSTLVAYSGHFAYSYHYDRILVVNLRDLTACRAPAPVSTEAIIFDGGQVLLVLFDGTHEVVDVAGAQPVSMPVQRVDFDGAVRACAFHTSPDGDGRSILPERLKDIEEFLEEQKPHARFVEACGHRMVTTSIPYFGLGGFVSRFRDGAVEKLYDARSCIRGLVRHGTGLVVCCVSRTFFYDLSTGFVGDFDRAAFPVLMERDGDARGEAVDRKIRKMGDGFVLIHGNTLRAVSTLAPSYACTMTCLNVLSNRSILYSDRSNTVTTYKSVDLSSFYIQLNDGKAVFYQNQIITGFYVMDASLFSLTVADVRSKASRLVIFRIKRHELVIRKETALAGVPLAFAGHKNTLAVVLPDRSLFFTLRNGRVRMSRSIAMRNDYAVEAMFLTATHLAVRGEDWSFRVVSLPSRRSRGYVRGGPCVPFVLDRHIGWAEGTTLFWRGARLDLGERISAVFSLDLSEGADKARGTVLVVVGSLGTVSLVRDVELDDEEKAAAWEALGKTSLAQVMGGL